MISRVARRVSETGVTLLVAAALIGIWYLIAWRLKASGDVTAAEKLPYPHLILERFDIRVSVSQLNRVRASLGLTYHPLPREKKLGWQTESGGDRLRVEEV